MRPTEREEWPIPCVHHMLRPSNHLFPPNFVPDDNYIILCPQLEIKTIWCYETKPKKSEKPAINWNQTQDTWLEPPLLLLQCSVQQETFQGENFREFQFCGYSWKFSLWNLGHGVLWRRISEQSTNVFFRKNHIFHQSAKVFCFPLHGTELQDPENSQLC